MSYNLLSLTPVFSLYKGFYIYLRFFDLLIVNKKSTVSGSLNRMEINQKKMPLVPKEKHLYRSFKECTPVFNKEYW